MSTLIVFLWIANVCFDTLGQTAFKYAASAPGTHSGIQYWLNLFKRPWLWIGVGAYLCEFPLWLAFLTLVPLSEGILLGSINIVAVMIVGRLLFKETLTPLRVTGILLVAGGVAIVGAF
ncbi:MAG: EamA family transporter [Betaproteobacteria bacterium]|nr:EamA family transporter [Betaproteobacteria bacterium]